MVEDHLLVHRLQFAGAHERTPKNRVAASTPSISWSISSVGRVDVRARPRRGGDAEPAVQGLRAVVPDAGRDATVIEELTDIVRMDAGDVEAREADPGLRGIRAEHADTRERPRARRPGAGRARARARRSGPCRCPRGSRSRRRGRSPATRAECRPRTAGAAACTRRTVIVTVVIIDPPVRNGGSAASSSRRPYSAPMPVGAEHLVAGEDREVDVEGLHVEREVRRRLARVEQHERARRRGRDARVRRRD